VDKSLKEVRASIIEKTVDIFSGYRQNFSGSHPPGQLVLPENLKEFSMYMLGLIKSRAFKGKLFWSSSVHMTFTFVR
jgi:protein transport protein SEC24